MPVECCPSPPARAAICFIIVIVQKTVPSTRAISPISLSLCIQIQIQISQILTSSKKAIMQKRSSSGTVVTPRSFLRTCDVYSNVHDARTLHARTLSRRLQNTSISQSNLPASISKRQTAKCRKRRGLVFCGSMGAQSATTMYTCRMTNARTVLK